MKTSINIIKDLIREHRISIYDKYGVKNIGVFGSVAVGRNTETSDVDILVEFEKPIGMFKFIELESYLGDIIGKKVDLATPKSLKPLIKDDILHEVIYV